MKRVGVLGLTILLILVLLPIAAMATPSSCVNLQPYAEALRSFYDNDPTHIQSLLSDTQAIGKLTLVRNDFRGIEATGVKIQNITVNVTADSVTRLEDGTYEVVGIETLQFDCVDTHGGVVHSGMQQPHRLVVRVEDGLKVLIDDFTPWFQMTGSELPAAAPLKASPTQESGISPMSTTHYYNRAGAVSYAHTWTSNTDQTLHNPNYPYFPDHDCANFVSQCMYQGGTATMDYTWYCNGLTDYSAAWIQAPSLYTYLTGKIDGFRGINSTKANMALGDVMFFDLIPAGGTVGDGQIEHAVIITKIDADGNLYYSAHTTNRYDYPLSLASSVYKVWYVKIVDTWTTLDN